MSGLHNYFGTGSTQSHQRHRVHATLFLSHYFGSPKTRICELISMSVLHELSRIGSGQAHQSHGVFT